MPQVATQYGDHRFHSRLAARWAVFFDILGMPFEYRQINYKLEALEGRIWSPDFYLPNTHRYGSSDGKETGTFVMALETKPNNDDLDCAGAVSGSFQCGLFWGPVAEKGLSCYSFSKDTQHVCPCLFGQCPFCGLIFLDSFEHQGRPTWSNHLCCIEQCDFAMKFDIDTCFMDNIEGGKYLPPPTDSPMLEIAKHAAKTIRFDSANSLAEVDGLRRSARLLKEKRVFASPRIVGAITHHAVTLSLDAKCPRFEEPWFFAHEKHKASGSTGPCPCTTCSRQKPEVSEGDLENMKTPEKRM